MNSSANMSDHVNHIVRKASARFWTIIHLKWMGFSKETLVTVYCSLMRPVIEYAAQVYSYQLTGEQSERLEAIQRRAFKIIFGPGVSYRQALELSQQEK